MNILGAISGYNFIHALYEYVLLQSLYLDEHSLQVHSSQFDVFSYGVKIKLIYSFYKLRKKVNKILINNR